MRCVAVLLGMALLVGPVTSARADSKALKILKQYEKGYTNYRALYNKFKLHVDGKHKATVATKSRPNGQRLLKLLYPGDVKGMHILIQSKSEMYIYLPAFRKVRRIAGHVRNQGFLGSAFTYDDMAISLWSKSHNAKIIKETSKHWTLELRAKKGRTVLYRHLRMRIRKDIHFTDKFMYFNRRGKNFKTQLFQRYKCVPDKSLCMPMRIVMVEHTRGNAKSVLQTIKYKRKKGYPDRMFTVRHLIRSAD